MLIFFWRAKCCFVLQGVMERLIDHYGNFEIGTTTHATIASSTHIIDCPMFSIVLSNVTRVRKFSLVAVFNSTHAAGFISIIDYHPNLHTSVSHLWSWMTYMMRIGRLTRGRDKSNQWQALDLVLMTNVCFASVELNDVHDENWQISANLPIFLFLVYKSHAAMAE